MTASVWADAVRANGPVPPCRGRCRFCDREPCTAVRCPRIRSVQLHRSGGAWPDPAHRLWCRYRARRGPRPTRPVKAIDQRAVKAFCRNRMQLPCEFETRGDRNGGFGRRPRRDGRDVVRFGRDRLLIVRAFRRRILPMDGAVCEGPVEAGPDAASCPMRCAQHACRERPWRGHVHRPPFLLCFNRSEDTLESAGGIVQTMGGETTA